MDEIKDLLKKIHLSNREEMQYSIMPLLYEKITAKELLHSDIIASLIDTSSENKRNTIFLQNFLIAIGVNEDCFIDFPELKIKTEHSIEERRRIDILITWDKYAVIIENKLNNAKDLSNQLLDYYNSISKNFDVIKIVYLPLYETKKAPRFKGIPQEKVINFPPSELILWLTKCAENLPKDEPEHFACQNYIDLLNYINIKNKNIMDARNILNNKDISFEEMKKLIDLSKIVSSTDWSRAKLEVIKSIFDNNNKGIIAEFREEYHLLDISYEDWKHYWIEIWSWYDYKFCLYIVDKTEDQSVPEIIENQGFKHDSFEKPDNYHYYKNEDKNYFEYSFPSDDNYEKLTSDIIKFLEKSR